jgi:hypothetical protein
MDEAGEAGAWAAGAAGAGGYEGGGNEGGGVLADSRCSRSARLNQELVSAPAGLRPAATRASPKPMAACSAG